MEEKRENSETKIFCASHSECVGFESRWKVKKVSSENATQTTEFKSSNQGCSTTEHRSIEIQTDSPEQPCSTEDTDMTKLAEWMNQIYPRVKKELDSANASRAFRNYRLRGADSVDATCKLVQEIQTFSKEGKGDGAGIVSCLSWNCFGNILAVSQSYNHKTWCHHTSLVLVYVLNRDAKLSATPKKKLATETCVTALSFHSSNSTILVAGTFTGQIYVWDIQNDIDSLVLTANAHDEIITQLSWVQDIDSKNTVLASSSLTGSLKLWRFRESNFNLKAKFKIRTPVLETNRYMTQMNQKALLEKAELGIVCFDFSKFSEDMFIVGMEGGVIVQCSLLGATEIKGGTKDEPLYDPVYKYYNPHEGDIVTVKFSPSHKEMFLTCGSDGEVRVYVLEQDDPAQIIFTPWSLNDVTWIPHESKLIAGCSQTGKVDIFNLISGKLVDYSTNIKVEKRVVPCMALNKKRPNYVVTGNNKGNIQLWDIPWEAIQNHNK